MSETIKLTEIENRMLNDIRLFSYSFYLKNKNKKIFNQKKNESYFIEKYNSKISKIIKFHERNN